ncbi:DUF4919 domain-containing protein [Chryseobacterium zhengzhouense]|uniref:DUF4919 domain-containing protein n=1 Tax=Chryseobacterium zhengzhouense TaxID=1636086 RepID=A0ABW2LW88_9FLAO
MKCRVLFFILMIPFLGFSQKLDFKEIEKNLSNEKSNYNYEKLIFKFKGMPKSLDSIEARHLYYGRNFRNDKVSTIDDDFKDLADSFKAGDFEECIKKGKILYTKDPTNLDVILILLRAYDQTKKVDDFVHHLSQLRLLTNAIRTSGDGKSEKTAFIVNSVGDEYIFLNILNVGQDYSRHSKTYKDSVIDVWTKDSNSIYIKVLYMDF